MMDRPTLFAETPRAGELGHRFLVPLNASVSETEMSRFSAAAVDRISFGENFVAVRRDIVQRLPGGSTRVGHEVIILAGVDVTSVSGSALSRTLESLQKFQDQLEQLVTKQIDWKTTASAGLVVSRPELVEWLDMLRAIPLPVTEWRTGPRPLCAASSSPVRPPCSNTTRGSAVAISLALAIGLSVGAIGCFGCYWIMAAQRKEAIAVMAAQREVAIAAATRKTAKLVDSPLDRPTVAPATNDNDTRPSNDSNVVDELLRQTIKADKVDAIVDLISWLPGNPKMSAQNRQDIVAYCSELLDQKRFDQAERLIRQILKTPTLFSLDAIQNARIADLTQQAKQGCDSFDSEDQKLYDLIRESTSTKQLDSAKKYLEFGQRQTMREKVNRWMTWAERVIEVEVVGIEVPSNEVSTIRFAANRREVGLSVDLGNGFRQKIVMTPLGITGQHLPATVSVTLQRDGNAFGNVPTRLTGELRLPVHSGGIKRVTLKSEGLSREEGTLTVQIPSFEIAPELPVWKKVSP